MPGPARPPDNHRGPYPGTAGGSRTWLRHPTLTGLPVDRWVAAHVAAVRAGALVLVVAVYLLWTRPTGAVVAWLTVILLLILAVVEFLRRGAELPAEPPLAGIESPAPALPVT